MARRHVPEYRCHTSRLNCAWFGFDVIRFGDCTGSTKLILFAIVVCDGCAIECETVSCVSVLRL